MVERIETGGSCILNEARKTDPMGGVERRVRKTQILASYGQEDKQAVSEV